MLNGLDLFSGIGGLSVALSPWVKTIAYCEIDSYCQSVLLSRMSDDTISSAPIWNDITTLLSSMLPRHGIDIVHGGFPCQDISVAGSGAGLEGKRSRLFFEIVRLVGELRPAFVFLENVPAITTRGGVRVVSEFTRLGYDCRWTIVSAAEFGACHIRRRWFLLAHSNSNSIRDESRGGHGTDGDTKAQLANYGSERDVANPKGIRSRLRFIEGQVIKKNGTYPRAEPLGGSTAEGKQFWTTEPDVGRVAHGVPFRVDRIKGLGNAVVPLQVCEAFKRLMGL